MAKTALTDLAIQKLKAPEKGQVTVFDTNLKGFGIRLSQGGSKTFVVVSGASRKLTTLGRYPDMGLKEARSLAKGIQSSNTAPSTSRASTTFLEARSAFLEAKARDTKPATVKQYRMYLNRITWGTLSSITRKDVTDHLKTYDGKNTSQNYAFGTLRTFFNWCLQEELLEHHPMIRARVPNRLKSRERVLTDDEIKAVWKATDFPGYGYFVRSLILTAQRKMEIYTLTEVGDSITFEDTKNGKSHTIPVTPFAREFLQVPFSIGHWSTRKYKLDADSGVTAWRLHDLRRTASTTMARLGIPSDIIERILNHTPKGVGPVYNRYRYEKEMRAALLTYEAHIRTLVTPGFNPSRARLPSGALHEDTEQARAANEGHYLDSALDAT